MIGRRPGWLLRSVLAVAFLALSVYVIPAISVDEDVHETVSLGLDRPAAEEVPGAAVAIFPPVVRGKYGYVIRGDSAGKVSIPILLPAGNRTKEVRRLHLWVYGSPSVEARSVLVRADGSKRDLGGPGHSLWSGRSFDITSEPPGSSIRLEVSARNRGRESALFVDRAAVLALPDGAKTSAPPFLVGVWIALMAAVLLQLGGRLSRHWPLPLIVGTGIYLLWDEVRGRGFEPLGYEPSGIWTHVVNADWLDLQTGLVSGSYGKVSSLAVQLFHALTPIVGTGAGAARAASAFVGIAALSVIYALGNRVAGRLAAAIAASVALMTEQFREAATSATSVTTLILAAALLAYVLHACVAEASLRGILLFAGAGALAVLADPFWLPGIVLAMGIVVSLYGVKGERLRLLGLGLLALALLLTPHRASVADQNAGNPFADFSERATIARNLEYAGRGHGTPPSSELSRDMSAGEDVGLTRYVLGEHSLPAVLGGTVDGGLTALSSFAESDDVPVLGAFAFLVGLAGFLYLLIVPRLRMLAALPVLVAAPELFLASRDASAEFPSAAFFFPSGHPSSPFMAGSFFWPVFVASAGLLAYVVLAAYAPALLHSEWLRSASARLLRRGGRWPERFEDRP